MLWEVLLDLGECGFKHMCLTTEPLSTNFGQSVLGKKECSNTQLGGLLYRNPKLKTEHYLTS